MFESKVEDINNAHILYHIDMFLFFTDLRLKESDIDICVTYSSGFGGLEVACWPLVRGFKPGRSRRIFKGEKNPQNAFLRRGSKAVGPMS